MEVSGRAALWARCVEADSSAVAARAAMLHSARARVQHFPSCIAPCIQTHTSCLHLPPPRRYGAYRRTLETTAEAQAWEAAKQAVG